MDFNRYDSSQNFAPSAPPLPSPNPNAFSSSESRPPYAYPYVPPPAPTYPYSTPPPPAYFPPGTPPEIVQSFHAVDRDRSGSIDEIELQTALEGGYQRFSIRTVRLLMFLFGNPSNHRAGIGPTEYTSLWICLRQWQGIFETFDRDRSGKIDSAELSDALLSLGYAIPPSVIQILVSKHDGSSGRRGSLNFDSFVECGMIVKGLTEKFKQKDTRYTGSATLTYETFMSMIIPFIVP